MTWSGNYYYAISLICCKVSLCGLILAITFLDAKDTITGGIDSIKDVKNETLISAGNRFQLGFFPLDDGDSGYSRYVGIWYYMLKPRTIVWVANRNSSLRESTGVFTIADNGNLVVMDRTGNSSYFSSSGPDSSPSGKERKVQLLDSGNLVLSDHDGNILWQSFDHPTDTFLPGMKMNQMLKLVSWKSLTDPFLGNFSFEMEEQTILVIKKKRTVDYYWKSGESGVGNSFDNPDNTIPSFVTFLLLNISQTSRTRNKYKLQPVAQNNINNNSRLWMSSNGKLEYLTWDNGVWNSIWSAPEDVCSVYNVCGAFGSCSSISESGTAVCKCLRGFKPKSVNDWNSGDFSSGCERNTTTCSTNYTFLELTMVKVGNPNSPFKDGDENKTECERACLENCQCLACSFKEINRRGSPKCWIWTSDLKNLQEHVEGAVNLSIRVAVADIVPSNYSSPFDGYSYGRSKNSFPSLAVILSTILGGLAVLLCIIGSILYRRKKKKLKQRQESRENIQQNQELGLFDTERRVKNFIGSGDFKEDDMKGIDVPFFDLESIIAATNNFSGANKLGQGGFGPVYKGLFPGGQEIAVKRLSSHSGQGLEEFKNEVVLIAKLQHRNLVRLLGYCIRGDEKILLYEYMPNKSLDSFIFDQTLSMALDWDKRFDIILGIARGLLYLHQDSRLRIIHRDLKTSNILLDGEMNPKISDFGLARIVGGKETEANTNRVVGTYGYMSPEYALDGLFSIKSDVFSFGVIVLEIVSGKRNTGFYKSQQALHLLGYAWSLWKQDKALDLIDQTLLESCNESQVLKCIIVGLLCVQEEPGDRPTMPNVIFMLGSETETLPHPKQPAFIAKKWLSDTPSSSSKPETLSINEWTISEEEPR